MSASVRIPWTKNKKIKNHENNKITFDPSFSSNDFSWM